VHQGTITPNTPTPTRTPELEPTEREEEATNSYSDGDDHAENAHGDTHT